MTRTRKDETCRQSKQQVIDAVFFKRIDHGLSSPRNDGQVTPEQAWEEIMKKAKEYEL